MGHLTKRETVYVLSDSTDYEGVREGSWKRRLWNSLSRPHRRHSGSCQDAFTVISARVDLLMRVHHRNLTSLVGYCNDETNIGLIYEYMANGNLREHLSGSRSNILSWGDRLQIAIEAAQGLTGLSALGLQSAYNPQGCEINEHLAE
ncbi:hypothetical protein DVH24_000313 [Malus domestica]|uniref:Serine-threonine/tyrosine-protein kinase catalytic domain-containing protein n=1 Tax=Malus domestica TaxID=3750 RepID=A0A498J319_MALDO|nr:hypothetical protein DVH24_000313 [Malus domestica]